MIFNEVTWWLEKASEQLIVWPRKVMKSHEITKCAYSRKHPGRVYRLSYASYAPQARTFPLSLAAPLERSANHCGAEFFRPWQDQPIWLSAVTLNRIEPRLAQQRGTTWAQIEHLKAPVRVRISAWSPSFLHFRTFSKKGKKIRKHQVWMSLG